VGREFLVTGVRTLAAVQGQVIAANYAGKVKTAVTLFAIVLVLVVASGRQGGLVQHIGHISAWWSVAWFAMLLVVALTVISGAQYIADARPLFLSDASSVGKLGELPSSPNIRSGSES